MIGIIRHWFIPHESNNHRARSLHIDALCFYLLLFAMFHVSTRTIHITSPNVLGYATDIFADQLLNSTNRKRTDAGLPALTMNAALSQAAAEKAAHMFANNYWAHTSPDGKTPWQFIMNTGYNYTVAGENLAKNFSNSQGVVDAWMASPTHKDNLLKPNYRDVGFAVVNGVLNGEETTLVVQMFGTSGTGQTASAKPTVPTPGDEPVTKPVVQADIPPVAQLTPVSRVEVAADSIDASGTVQNSVSRQPSGTAFSPPQVYAAPTSLSQGVKIQPAIDIAALTKTVTYIFVISLMMVLVLDAAIVYRKKVVRVSGHNIAHILLLLAMAIAVTLSVKGNIL